MREGERTSVSHSHYLTFSHLVQGGNTEVWHYLDGIEFKNGARQSINHEEGRIVYNEPLPMPNGGNHTYQEWFLKDHLGDTRVRFVDKDQDGLIDLNVLNPQAHEISGAYHYYPFGMEFEGDFNGQQAHLNRYRYNGKEWNNLSGWYDYGFRQYDPVIGRFTSVDLLAEHAADLTSYRFGFNNPILFIDPDGMFESRADARKYKKEKGEYGRIEKWEDGTFRIVTRDHHRNDCTFITKDKDFGVIEGLYISPTDVMSSRTVDNWVFGDYKLNVLRDGTEVDGGQTYIGGDGPSIGPGKVFKFFRATDEIGELVTSKKAIEILKRGDDILATTRQKAKSLMKKASGGGKVIRDRAHQRGYRDHYHDFKRKLGHSFYGGRRG